MIQIHQPPKPRTTRHDLARLADIEPHAATAGVTTEFTAIARVDKHVTPRKAEDSRLRGSQVHAVGSHGRHYSTFHANLICPILRSILRTLARQCVHPTAVESPQVWYRGHSRG